LTVQNEILGDWANDPAGTMPGVTQHGEQFALLGQPG
jgi:hypothetical protein